MLQENLWSQTTQFTLKPHQFCQCWISPSENLQEGIPAQSSCQCPCQKPWWWQWVCWQESFQGQTRWAGIRTVGAHHWHHRRWSGPRRRKSADGMGPRGLLLSPMKKWLIIFVVCCCKLNSTSYSARFFIWQVRHPKGQSPLLYISTPYFHKGKHWVWLTLAFFALRHKSKWAHNSTIQITNIWQSLISWV